MKHTNHDGGTGTRNDKVHRSFVKEIRLTLGSPESIDSTGYQRDQKANHPSARDAARSKLTHPINRPHRTAKNSVRGFRLPAKQTMILDGKDHQLGCHFLIMTLSSTAVSLASVKSHPQLPAGRPATTETPPLQHNLTPPPHNTSAMPHNATQWRTSFHTPRLRLTPSSAHLPVPNT